MGMCVQQGHVQTFVLVTTGEQVTFFNPISSVTAHLGAAGGARADTEITINMSPKNAVLFAFILERGELMWGQTEKVRVYDLYIALLSAALIHRGGQPCQPLRLIILSWLTINANE